MSELITIEKKELLEFFSTKDGLKPVLENIKKLVSEYELNTDTEKSRKEIASLAHKVSKSKTHLDAIRKTLTEDWRQKTAIVNGEWKKAEKYLDELRDLTRIDLTRYETLEKEKVLKMKDLIKNLNDLSDLAYNGTIEKMRFNLKCAIEFQVDEDTFTEDFEFKAYKAKDKTIKSLNEMIEAEEKKISDAKELAALREKNRIQEKLAKERTEIEKKNLMTETNQVKEKTEVPGGSDNMPSITPTNGPYEGFSYHSSDTPTEGHKAPNTAILEAAPTQSMDNRKSELKTANMEATGPKENLVDTLRERRRVIHNLILDAMKGLGIKEADAKTMIIAIGQSKIPHISIEYISFVESDNTTSKRGSFDSQGKPMFKLNEQKNGMIDERR